jgi:hypothetical protein
LLLLQKVGVKCFLNQNSVFQFANRRIFEWLYFAFFGIGHDVEFVGNLPIFVHEEGVDNNTLNTSVTVWSENYQHDSVISVLAIFCLIPSIVQRLERLFEILTKLVFLACSVVNEEQIAKVENRYHYLLKVVFKLA